MNCKYGSDPEQVERYVSGQLSSDEAADFELHFFECNECLSSVQAGQSMGGYGEPSSVAKVIEMPIRRAETRRTWVYTAAAAAVVILAALVGWRTMTSQPAPKTEPAAAATTIPSNPAPPPPHQPAAHEPQLMALNRLEQVDPPPYRDSVLRGTGNDDEADRFQRAMKSYSAGDYRKAATELAQIPVGVPGSGRADDHITDAGVQVYLGVSRLMNGQNEDAARALRKAIGYGDTPYVESAHYYLAKSLIRQKRYTDAASELRETAGLNGDRKAAAGELLEQIAQLASSH